MKRTQADRTMCRTSVASSPMRSGRLIVTLAVVSLSFLACLASPGIRLNTGPARSDAEIAKVDADVELVEVEGIISGKENLAVPKTSRVPLLLMPGHYTLLLRTPDRIAECKAVGTRVWKMPVDLGRGKHYTLALQSRAYEIKLDAAGNGCAQRADVGPVELEELSDASRSRMAIGQPIAAEELANLLAPPNSSATRSEPVVADTTPRSITITGHIATPERIGKIATAKTRIQLIPFGDKDKITLVADGDGVLQYQSAFQALELPDNQALVYPVSVPPGRYVLAVTHVDLSKVATGSPGTFSFAPPPPVVFKHSRNQYVDIVPTLKDGDTLDLGELSVDLLKAD